MQSKSQRFFEKIYCRFENKHDNDHLRRAGRGENVVKYILLKAAVSRTRGPLVIVLPRKNRRTESGTEESVDAADAAADLCGL